MLSDDKNGKNRRNAGSNPLDDPTSLLKNNENGKGNSVIIPASVASLVRPNKEKLKSVVAEKTDHVSGVATYRAT